MKISRIAFGLYIQTFCYCVKTKLSANIVRITVWMIPVNAWPVWAAESAAISFPSSFPSLKLLLDSLSRRIRSANWKRCRWVSPVRVDRWTGNLHLSLFSHWRPNTAILLRLSDWKHHCRGNYWKLHCPGGVWWAVAGEVNLLPMFASRWWLEG